MARRFNNLHSKLTVIGRPSRWNNYLEYCSFHKEKFLAISLRQENYSNGDKIQLVRMSVALLSGPLSDWSVTLKKSCRMFYKKTTEYFIFFRMSCIKRTTGKDGNEYTFFYTKAICFSNFWKCEKLEINGISFSCTEQYFMHQKSGGFCFLNKILIKSFSDFRW